MAAAITNGDLTLDNCPLDALLAAISTLGAAGVHVEPLTSLASVVPGAAPVRQRTPSLTVTGSGGPVAGANGSYPTSTDDPMRRTVRVTCDRTLRPVEVTTQPHPGFPTDLQAQLVALLTLADGNSVVTERIFPDRFLHVAELLRMGAKIIRQGSTIVISGTKNLVGAPVMASDLRASAGLVLAGMAAEGTTIVNRVYHLDRGYERMEERLRSLGASIQRVDEKELAGSEAASA
jgi:UDP-N-acetylglucosamine 1-carboxyvinyltransferase